MVGHRESSRRQRVLRILRRVAIALAGIVLLLALVATLYVVTLPSVGDAPTRVREILAQHREATAPLPAPSRLVAAVVSTEDEHFYDNIVINVLTGVGRAGLAALQAEGDPGGSTIQQQLAKTLYGRQESVLGTLREIGLGVKLALVYSHLQILRMYLNSIYYGNGDWGVAAAARGYFRTTPARLSWGEAAMLAGLVQAPSAYDPRSNYALARDRQRHVLSQLVVNHYLTAAQANVAFAAGLPLSRRG